MNTAYGPTATATPLTTHEQRAARATLGTQYDHIALDDIDWDLLADRYDALRDHAPGVPNRITGPAETDPCAGSGCLDGDECDAEYRITHRAHSAGWLYRTPVCRGCLPHELAHLRHPSNTANPDTIRVELPLPLVNP